MRILSYLFLVLIIILGVTFATLNSEIVTIHYYISQRTMPLSMLLVIVFALGCLMGMLAATWFIIKTKMKNYRLRRQLTLAEKEVENLRAIPLRDQH